MYAPVCTQQPAAVCALKSPADAIHILEAVRVGLVPRVTRRLTGPERGMIRPGTVWVWEEEETNMRRWTDGRRWGASRVGGGGFLVYTESSESLSPPGETYPRRDPLVKQTYSTSVGYAGKTQKFHVVAYSSKHNPQGDVHAPLPLPHQLPLLANLLVTPGIWPEWQRRDSDPRRHSFGASSSSSSFPAQSPGNGHGHGHANGHSHSHGQTLSEQHYHQHSYPPLVERPAEANGDRYHPYRSRPKLGSNQTSPIAPPYHDDRRTATPLSSASAMSAYTSMQQYSPYTDAYRPDPRPRTANTAFPGATPYPPSHHQPTHYHSAAFPTPAFPSDYTTPTQSHRYAQSLPNALPFQDAISPMTNTSSPRRTDDELKFTLPPLRVAIDADPLHPRKSSRSPPGSMLSVGETLNPDLPPTLPLPIPAHPMQLSSSAGPPLGPYMSDTRQRYPMTARQAQ